MDTKITLPSISELTKFQDVKLPDLRSYSTSKCPPIASQVKLPSISLLTLYTPAPYSPPTSSSASPVSNSFSFNYTLKPALPESKPVTNQPSPPTQTAQTNPSPVSVTTGSPAGYSYYVPYYSSYYHSPTQQNQYLVPEVVNKPINKCHRCGTTETPEWRRGPNGVRTLCNACGLYHAKLVKRKGAQVAAQEVLNNKVCKGKNGRRISIKKALINNKLI